MNTHLTLFEVHPNKLDKLREWFASLRHERHFDALVALEKSNVTREFGTIVKIGSKFYALYFVDGSSCEGPMDNLVNESTFINQQHEQIKKECLKFPPLHAPLAYDLTDDLW